MLLVEQEDLASGTSSASTKLIHGGLRYLEHGAFRLVREALNEREVLLRNRAAYHPADALRAAAAAGDALAADGCALGLFLYDHLGARKILPATQRRRSDPPMHLGEPLRRASDYGFEYSDCWVDDARLVRAERARCGRARRDDPHPHDMRARRAQRQLAAGARMRAAGARSSPRGRWSMPPAPGSAPLRKRCCVRRGRRACRLVKGSHIVVPRLFDHDSAYIFQNPDRRVVFALPYRARFHADRHHRREFRAVISAAIAPNAEEIALSVRRCYALFPQSGDAEPISWAPSPACARSTTTGRESRRTSRATIVSTRQERGHGAAA